MRGSRHVSLRPDSVRGFGCWMATLLAAGVVSRHGAGRPSDSDGRHRQALVVRFWVISCAVSILNDFVEPRSRAFCVMMVFPFWFASLAVWRRAVSQCLRHNLSTRQLFYTKYRAIRQITFPQTKTSPLQSRSSVIRLKHKDNFFVWATSTVLIRKRSGMLMMMAMFTIWAATILAK